MKVDIEFPKHYSERFIFPPVPLPDHLERFPMMTPFVGEKFGIDGNRRMLIIGESHYLPTDDHYVNRPKRHTGPGWYSVDPYDQYEGLSQTEIEYISTGPLIWDAFKKNPGNRSFAIYLNIARELNRVGPRYTDDISAIEHIAFYNYFQRPAPDNGGSMEGKVVDRDVEVARDVLTWVIAWLNPEIVIFASKVACDEGKAFSALLQANELCGMPVKYYERIPHPGCKHWNMRWPSYGTISGAKVADELTGRERFQYMLRSWWLSPRTAEISNRDRERLRKAAAFLKARIAAQQALGREG
jgi:hypothetical protein